MLSAALPGRQPVLLLALLLAGPPPQAQPPRYSAQMLECAVYGEEIESDIQSESGGVMRRERTGREGRMVTRGVATDSGIAITAWYDTLTVWRQGPEGRVAPDAEGLFGGRWRGILRGDGRYRGAQVPFVPDEVAELTDLRGVLSDFFPPLDPGILRPVPGGPGRYRWSATTRSDTTGAVNDTLVVPMRRESSEEGSLVWDPRLGPIHWERTVKVTAVIEAKGPVRRGIRSTVTQRIRVTRLAGQVCE